MFPTWYQYSPNSMEYCMWPSVNWLKNCFIMVDWDLNTSCLVDLAFQPSLLHWSTNKLLTQGFFKPIKSQCCRHIENSQLFCCTNQMIAFYVRAALGFNGLNTILPTLNITRLNSVRMRENTDQNNSKYGQFSRTESYYA